MSDTSVAVDTLERLAVQLQGIQEAATQLRQIGSFDQAILDRQEQLDTLTKQVAMAEGALNGANLSLESVQAQSAQAVKDATDKAGALADQAEQEYEAKIAKAIADAEAVRRNEELDRENALSGLTQQIAEAEAARAVLQLSIASAKEELATVMADIEAAKASMAEIQRQALAVAVKGI
jgi:chromosome segregation ATPase